MAHAPMMKPPPTVRELMAPRPSSIDQFDTVVAAARRMRASGLISIPVTGLDGLFVGMLSDRDIVERCIAAGLDPSSTTVGSVFQPEQSTTFPDRIVDAAVVLQIAQNPAAELPVVEDGLLIGMLSIADVAIPLLGDIDINIDIDTDTDIDTGEAEAEAEWTGARRRRRGQPEPRRSARS